MDLFPAYDLSGNWIINGPSQQAGDVGLEKPSEPTD